MLIFFLCATDLPDPVTNCSAYNATAYTMQFTCVPGNDGGIRQSFFVEVINSQAQGEFPFARFFNIRFAVMFAGV